MKNKIFFLLKRNRIIFSFLVRFANKVQQLKRKNPVWRKIWNLIFKKKDIEKKNTSVWEYCENCGIERVIIEERRNRPVFIPPFFEKQENGKVKLYELPEIYHTVLKDVTVIGESDVIIKDEYCLNDKYLLRDRRGIRFESDTVLHWTEGYCTVEVNRKQQEIEEAVSLIGQAANNYYHWVFDILGKLVYINQFSQLKAVPLLVDETVARHGTCMKLLQIMDECSHPVVLVKRNKSYKINRLYYFSPCTWSSVYRKKESERYEGCFAKPETMINSYRNQILGKMTELQPKVGKKIFLIRRGEKVKRMVNEDVIARIAESYGFDLYEPSQYSIMQQAVDFHYADFIIAASGAALVNLLWCHQGAKVAYVWPRQFRDYNYSTLAYLVQAECDCLDADLIREGDYLHVLDEEYFIRYLTKQGFTKI